MFKFVIRKIPRNTKNTLKDSKLNILIHLHQNFKALICAEKFYSQTGEDAILSKLLPGKSGSYVDVGAGHPVKTSNTYLFYKRGWRGICIDPIAVNRKLHRIIRPKDKFWCALIGPDKGSRIFYEFEPYALSTVDEKVAAKVMEIKDVRLLSSRKLQILPLSEIIPSSIKGPVFLNIDVEGFDLEVLKSNDWSVFRPEIICIEEWQPLEKSKDISDIEFFLTQKNYTKLAYTGLSSIFITNS